jgi:hypothetical protein
LFEIAFTSSKQAAQKPKGALNLLNFYARRKSSSNARFDSVYAPYLPSILAHVDKAVISGTVLDESKRQKMRLMACQRDGMSGYILKLPRLQTQCLSLFLKQQSRTVYSIMNGSYCANTDVEQEILRVRFKIALHSCTVVPTRLSTRNIARIYCRSNSSCFQSTGENLSPSPSHRASQLGNSMTDLANSSFYPRPCLLSGVS